MVEETEAKSSQDNSKITGSKTISENDKKKDDCEIVDLDSSNENSLSSKPEPVKRESVTNGNLNIEDSDSNSDILVIDIDEEIAKNKIIEKDEKVITKEIKESNNDIKKESIKSETDFEEKEIRPVAAKRKRISSSKSDNDDSESLKPASKRTARRASSTSVKKFEQVENELEAMFAGLESEEDQKDPEIKQEKDLAKVTAKPANKSIIVHPSSKPRQKEAYIVQPSPKLPKEEKRISKPTPKVAEASRSVLKKTPRRKSTETNKKSSKDSKKDKSNHSSSNKNHANFAEQEKLLEKYKGPFARVEGSLSEIRWTNVINNVTDRIDSKEDIEPDFDQISKVTGFGYTLTTLNSKYDPRTADLSWVCCFCRKPGHYAGMGDLFGPYFINVSQWKNLNLPSPTKVQSKSDLASSFILGGSDQAGAKAKKKAMLKRKSEQLNENTSKSGGSSSAKNSTTGNEHQGEVWFHEDCVCWMPQIRLIGCQLLGLSEAIRDSQKAVCAKCNYRGSTLACSQMRCRETVHYPCGLDLNWVINEDEFLAKCSKCAANQK